MHIIDINRVIREPSGINKALSEYNIENGSYVYVLKFQDGLYKIGRTSNLGGRILSHFMSQKGYGFGWIKIVLIIKSSDVIGLEKRVLSAAPVRPCIGKEIFEINEQDLKYIRALV